MEAGPDFQGHGFCLRFSSLTIASAYVKAQAASCSGCVRVGPLLRIPVSAALAYSRSSQRCSIISCPSVDLPLSISSPSLFQVAHSEAPVYRQGDHAQDPSEPPRDPLLGSHVQGELGGERDRRHEPDVI